MPVTLLRQLPALSHTRLAAARTRAACDPPSAAAGGLGTLYIDEQRLVFFSPEANRGFSVDYPSIVIHAISRNTDLDSAADISTDSVGAHLYCQLDGPFPDSAEPESSEDDVSDDEQFAELKFFPDDEQLLDDMFKAMSACAALNPDDDEAPCSDSDDVCVGDYYRDGASSGDDAEDADDDSAVQAIDGFDSAAFITTADQLDRLTPKGKATLAHLESVIVEPACDIQDDNADGRFDDAD
ncbi:hypothetical protein GGI00_000840 [Coemansia sp. RSA 2681]|nr:hypothetical protein GGI00_000840 [Coemansia sp. RSA 2681]